MRFISKNYLLLVILLLVILLVLLFYFSSKKSSVLIKEKTPSTSPVVLPTTFIIKNDSTVLITPTLIVPTFTGVKDEDLPQDVLNLSQAKQELKKKLPVKTDSFSLDFDYSEDKFTVSLNEPKEKNRAEFENWLKSNYSVIPVDRFIIK